MSRHKRVKGYWSKKKERFSNGRQARCRATLLRTHEHISHVLVDRIGEEYVVAYSIAKWYAQELKSAGIKL